MIDKREPSMDALKPRPGEEEGTAPAPRLPVAPAAAAPRAKGPPQDPVAFQRWLGIEQLKVDMRRLELENKRAETPPAAPRAGSPVLPVLYGLVLIAVLGLAAFLTAQVIDLRQEVALLRGAQSEIAEKLQTLEMTPPPAPQAAAPVDAAPVAAAPAAPAAPSAAPAASDPLVPLAGTTPMPAPAETTEAPAPALPGTGYTVRIFAPVNTVPKTKVENFISPLKAAGFDVVVSDTGVVQTTSNTLSFHGASTDMANDVVKILQKRHPALGIEMRASPSIPDNARQVLILNLTEEAFN